MDQFNKETLDKMLRRVRSLLERAEHPATPIEEANSCRQTAEAIMFKYRIAEATAVDKGTSLVTPVKRLFTYDLSSRYSRYYGAMLVEAIAHTQCYGVQGYWTDDNGRRVYGIMGYGYDSDLRYAEELFLAARLAFSSRMEPTDDSSLPEDERVFLLRASGMERPRIAQLVYGNRDYAQKVTTTFKRYCRAHDVSQEEMNRMLGKGNNMKVWKEAFCEGFISTLSANLWRARNAVERESGGLVPVSRMQRVKEFMYQDNPDLRPTTKLVEVKACVACKYCKNHKSDMYAREGHKPQFGNLKCACRPCRWHKPYRQTKADVEREERVASSPGQSAGRSAADRVNIRPEGNPTVRLGD
jgi:hypothetical protein